MPATRGLHDSRSVSPGIAGHKLPIEAYLHDLHASLKSEFSGEIATYIPELGRADPASFAICLATVDGALYAIGDATLPFTIQSMSKPFTYGRALREHGRERVLRKVGVEPTGEAFNSIVLDDVHNRPFNPMVNAGAIAVADLIDGPDAASREAALLDLFSSLAGRPLAIDDEVYRSEKATGHRNRAIAWMMLNSGMLDRDPEQVLDLYFRQCSVLVTCEDMARMGATLANEGVNPATGETVFPAEVVRDVLTLMSTCGMYDFAGQWAYEVGIPAKSGVSGGIVAVVPGQLGIAVYSPLLDSYGNSIRGVEVCRRLSADYALHAFSGRNQVRSVVRRVFRGDAVSSKRVRSGADRAILSVAGGSIAAIEVQGALYFGSADVLARQVMALAADARFLILDLRRIHGADDAAISLIRSTLRSVVEAGLKVAVSGLKTEGAGARLAALVAGDASLSRVVVHDHLDKALQSFEDTVLAEHPDRRHLTRFALADLDLLRTLSPEDLRALEPAVRTFGFEPGQVIVREGDPGTLLFVLAKGTASVTIRLPDGSRRRVNSIGPGQCFGEMALLDGGPRSADVTADDAVLCYAFSVEQIRDIAKERPAILTTILGNLIKVLSERLRLATNEIRTLE